MVTTQINDMFVLSLFLWMMLRARVLIVGYCASFTLCENLACSIILFTGFVLVGLIFIHSYATAAFHPLNNCMPSSSLCEWVVVLWNLVFVVF